MTLIPDKRYFNRHKPTIALYYNWKGDGLFDYERVWFEPVEDEE